MGPDKGFLGEIFCQSWIAAEGECVVLDGLKVALKQNAKRFADAFCCPLNGFYISQSEWIHSALYLTNGKSWINVTAGERCFKKVEVPL